MNRMPTSLLFLLAVASLLLCGCGDDDDSPAGPVVQYTVSGTLTLPSSVTNRPWYVAIDVDNTGQTGFTYSASGTASGNSIDYQITGVSQRCYYVYAEVDMAGDPGPWDPGDYVGAACMAGAEMCTVTISADTTIDLDLEEY